MTSLLRSKIGEALQQKQRISNFITRIQRWYFSHDGASSFPVGHEVYGKTSEKFMPSWERARTQHD